VHKYLQTILLGFVLLGIVASASHSYPQRRKVSPLVAPASTKADKPYSTDLKELRTRFNKDKGKVRLLMLLSPT
jgi:hypothetical protein